MLDCLRNVALDFTITLQEVFISPFYYVCIFNCPYCIPLKALQWHFIPFIILLLFEFLVHLLMLTNHCFFVPFDTKLARIEPILILKHFSIFYWYIMIEVWMAANKFVSSGYDWVDFLRSLNVTGLTFLNVVHVSFYCLRI